MFSSQRLFSNVECPVGSQCELPSCIFLHRADNAIAHHQAEKHAVIDMNKRRKLSHGSEERAVPPRQSTAPFVGNLSRPAFAKTVKSYADVHSYTEQKSPLTAKDIDTAARAISPPPPRNAPKINSSPKREESKSKDAPKDAKAETLNPRMMAKPPASHANRMSYVKKLHEFMSRLNTATTSKASPTASNSKLGQPQLIKLVLDEEEKVAREHSTMYAHMIRRRLTDFSKMTAQQWRDYLEPESDEEADAAYKIDLSSGLPIEGELQVLNTLIADQSGLEKYGYITSPASQQDITSVRAAVELCHGYEQCDRCNSRFQVFPERREDGALTTGGTCTYHHGRANFQGAAGSQKTANRSEKRYTCCNETVGTSFGCTTADTHVFKISDKARLASILQFKQTPANPDASKDPAIAFDCEMGYTVYGMELIRLTAVSWPTGDGLIDVLVKPLGQVLDLNSRYSGVTATDFTTAPPYDYSTAHKAVESKGSKKVIPMVKSPEEARKLLFDLISPTTPLIGHAIENDLTSTRIVHPSIVDTVLLFPLKRGLPVRPALRSLALEHLKRIIQAGGPAGHDSHEDAKATGDLVRLAVGRKWRKLRTEGYEFVNNTLLPPPSKSVAYAAQKMRDEIRAMKAAKESNQLDKGNGEKARKKRARQGSANGSIDDMDFWHAGD